MDRLIEPLDKISSEVSLPGSKSIANRALITAALANGKSLLKNFPRADDCMIMLSALQKFGIEISYENNNVLVNGNPNHLHAPDDAVYTANAGTVMRFLTSFATLAEGVTILTGDDRMCKRPISGLAEALNNLGANIITNNGYPPVKVHGKKFVGGVALVDSKISSQFISSILLSSPYAENSVEIFLKDKIPSKGYLEITIDVMKAFGVNIECRDFYYKVANSEKYHPIEYTIEGDFSSASYFILAALITKGKIKLMNAKRNTKQPDAHFLKIAEEMSCCINYTNNGIIIDASEANIKQFEIDANNFPDLVPTLAILAIFADGKSKIFNVEHLRYKETDRLSAIAIELQKVGVGVKEFSDGLIIYPNKSYQGTEIETYNDHRIAMSFAIAGLRIKGIRIKNSECVNKSFPDFWKEFEKLY